MNIIILSLFLFFPNPPVQNVSTIAICQCSNIDIFELVEVAKFHGYRFENHFMKETGISEYSSSLRGVTPASSTVNLQPKLVIINHNKDQNKKILLISNLEKIETNFEIVNREYYSKDGFLKLILYN